MGWCLARSPVVGVSLNVKKRNLTGSFPLTRGMVGPKFCVERYVVQPPNRRQAAPAYLPDARVVRMINAGVDHDEIAKRIGSSTRAVYRWAAGDAQPMPIFNSLLDKAAA